MDIIKAQKAIEAVAQLHDVPVEEVIEEIQIAIVSAQKNTAHDPTAQEHWKKISAQKDPPTVQALIAYIINQLEKERFVCDM